MKVTVSSSDGRFSHAAFAWSAVAHSPLVTVCAKITYDIRPGKCTVAKHQLPLVREDQHWGAEPSRSLFVGADVVPAKVAPEVVLVGAAHAPDGVPVTSIDVRLRVGAWSKTLRVVGDRTRLPDGTVSPPKPFARMPLVYERAAGGPGSDNPVGVPPGGDTLPNVEAENGFPGFGAVPAFWPTRKAHLGARLAAPPSLEELARDGYPPGFAEAFFQCSPPDQRLRPPLGDIDIELTHLLRDHPILVSQLQGAFLRACEAGEVTADMKILHADTIWIDADRGVVAVTYRATIAAHGPEVKIALVVVPSDASLPFDCDSDAAETTREPAQAVAARLSELIPSRSVSPALPFQTSTLSPSGAPRGAAPFPVTPPPALMEPRPVPRPPPRIAALSPLSAVAASNLAASGTPAAGDAPRNKPLHDTAVAVVRFDGARAADLRRVEAWREILRRLPEARGDASGSTAEVEDARDFGEVLRRARARSLVTLDEELSAWIGEVGGTKPAPLLCIEGTLRTELEPRHVLRAVLRAARPLARSDPALQARLAEITSFVEDASEMTPTEDFAEALRALREGLDRSIPLPQWEDAAERTVAERRGYEEVDLWGGRFVPVWLRSDGSDVVARRGFLPKEAAARLPLAPSTRVRALVEVVPSQVSESPLPASFRVCALARRVQLPSELGTAESAHPGAR